MSFTQDAYTYAGKPSREQGGYLPHKRYPVPGAQLTNGAAGISTGRVTELSLHTRKRTDWTQKDGRLFRELTEPGHPPPAPHALKKSQLRYCGLHPEEQRMHFQTRWKPVDGKMAFCTGRRGGSATVECDYEFIDRQQTYHTWKRMGNSQPHKESHLQFDRFLTVDEAAHRTDRLPQVRNRNPPLPNDDGPFEKPRKNGGNLDRTFMPREDALRRDSYSTAPKPLRPIKVSHLNMSTLQNETGVDRGELRSGTKFYPVEDHAFDFVRGPEGADDY